MRRFCYFGVVLFGSFIASAQQASQIMPESTLYTPNPGRQSEFVSSSVDEAAWLGEAGTGKGISYALDFLYDVHKPLHNAIIFRKAYKDLEDLLAKFDRIFPSYGGKFDNQRHVWNFPSKAKFWMAYLENEKQVEAWNGHEFSAIYWDELSQFSRFPYLYMIRNNRCSDPTIQKRIRSGANPYGFGAAWVWDRFPNALREGEIGYFKTVNGRDVRVPKGDGGFSRSWFLGVRKENDKGDPDYERNLDMLPTEAMRQAYKFGKFVQTDHPDQLIRAEWVDAAINGKNTLVPHTKAFGVDYSEGGDNCIMYSGMGNQVQKAREWGGTPEDKAFLYHPVFARWLSDWIRDEGKYQILGGIDTVGTGAGVYTCIQDIDPSMGERINPVRKKDYNLERSQDAAAVKLHFKNIQDQYMWKLREDFKFGRIDLSPLQGEQGYYPNLHLLREELLAFRFKEDKNTDGSMWISSSNDLRKASWPGGEPCLGRSPDRAKALAIWNGARDWTPEKAPPPNTGANRNDYTYQPEDKKVEVSSPLV